MNSNKILLSNKEEHIKPFIKWPGGKDSELEIIMKNFPKDFNKYLEPFIGGGAIFLNTRAKEYYINDKSKELITLYSMIKSQNQSFYSYLERINNNWNIISIFVENNQNKLINLYKAEDLSIIESFINKNVDFFKNLVFTESDFKILEYELLKNMISKITRSKKIEYKKGKLPDHEILNNLECCLKSAYYMYLRNLYNSFKIDDLPSQYSAIFYFIREFCYSSMFRYNNQGHFNVPYGGISYNKKDFTTRINQIKSVDLLNKLSKTNISCTDFEVFLTNQNLNQNDFIFLDPPYDTDFSTYAKNKFDKNDQIRLSEYLKSTKANFLLVIKETDFIKSLYKDFYITSFEKKYLVSFKNRNNKKTNHLLIKNYGDK